MRTSLLALAAFLTTFFAAPLAAQENASPAAGALVQDYACARATTNDVVWAGADKAPDCATLSVAPAALAAATERQVGVAPDLLTAVEAETAVRLNAYGLGGWVTARGIAACPNEGEVGWTAWEGVTYLLSATTRCPAPPPVVEAEAETKAAGAPVPPVAETVLPPMPTPPEPNLANKLAEIEAAAKAAVLRAEATQAKLTETEAQLADVAAQLIEALKRTEAAEARVKRAEAMVVMAEGRIGTAENQLAICKATAKEPFRYRYHIVAEAGWEARLGLYQGWWVGTKKGCQPETFGLKPPPKVVQEAPPVVARDKPKGRPPAVTPPRKEKCVFIGKTLEVPVKGLPPKTTKKGCK